MSKCLLPSELVMVSAFVTASVLGCGTRTELLDFPLEQRQAHQSGGAGGRRTDTRGAGGSAGAAGGQAGGYSDTGGSGGDYNMGGSGGSSPVDFGPFAVGAYGFVTSGTWQGYAWAVVDSLSGGSSISPATFSDIAAGSGLCVKGVVAPDPAWGGFAILGLNIAQPQAGDNSVWSPTGSGLTYNITNPGASPLRIQIQGAAGYPTESWCVTLTGTQGKLAWSQFNSRCWDNSGTVYDGTVPLNSVMVLVPGSNLSKVPYNFCLNSIGPV